MSLLEIILLSYVLLVQIVGVIMNYYPGAKSKISEIIIVVLFYTCFFLLTPIVLIVDLFKKIAERKHLKNQVQEDAKRDDIRFEEAFEEAKERVLTKEEKESFKYCGCYSMGEKKINKEEEENNE